jgi:hypothetical protein
MKILSIIRIEYFFVETDEIPHKLYRRNVDGNQDCWEILMGDSWEAYYTGSEELEQLLNEMLLKI